jgi:hypothetical protein
MRFIHIDSACYVSVSLLDHKIGLSGKRSIHLILCLLLTSCYAISVIFPTVMVTPLQAVRDHRYTDLYADLCLKLQHESSRWSFVEVCANCYNAFSAVARQTATTVYHPFSKLL